jgi:phage-related protein
LIKLLDGLGQDLWRIVASAVAFVVAFCTALGDQAKPLVDAALDFITKFLVAIGKAIEQRAPDFIKQAYEFAKAFVDNLVTELFKQVEKVVNALRDIIKNAIAAAVKWLTGGGGAYNEPGKTPNGLGQALGDGMAAGLANGTGDLEDTAVNAMAGVMAAIAAAVDQNVDFTPTITPVLDLSAVTSGANSLGNVFGNQTLNVGAVAAALPTIPGRADNFGVGTNADTPPNQNGTTFNFTQTNNSPKTLSQLDIYRQTQRQLDQMKGLMGAR